MKPFWFVILIAAACNGGTSRAQDAATQERLDKLSGQIEDVIATQRAQQKQLESLAREIDSLREAAARHTGNYASQDDVKHLADAIKDVDRKRMEEGKNIAKQVQDIGAMITKEAARRPAPAPVETKADKPVNEKGYSHTVQSGDTLSTIVQAYREKNVKVSTEQILKANPKLKPEKMKVGDKIWIPAPQ
jgi:LysM repeat protein